MIIKREITNKLKQASKQFGVVSLTGPRQSGKTTLVKNIFKKHKYINLEDFSALKYIMEDPKGFIKGIKGGIIIDEIQLYPELLSYIQLDIDENFVPGKFIITGSQNLLLSEKISQSLAGRVAVLLLLPFSFSEIKNKKFSIVDINKIILDGFYPGYITRIIDRGLFFNSYIQTYIERDVRLLKNIGDLTNFRRFLAIIAGRIGQILNMSSIANDIGVDSKTINNWISILEASYIIFRLPPYYKNYGKRIIKSPKLYFYDTGLATYLLGIDSIRELSTHYMRGNLFENFVISEILKFKSNHLSSSQLYFWRDKSGREIDLLIVNGQEEIIMEIKAGQTFKSEFSKSIEFYSKLTHNKLKKFVIYNGDNFDQNPRFKVLNWKFLDEITKLL